MIRTRRSIETTDGPCESRSGLFTAKRDSEGNKRKRSREEVLELTYCPWWSSSLSLAQSLSCNASVSLLPLAGNDLP